MAKNKSALIKSLIALMLSVSMLVGTTFAWFTDNVSSGNNIIVSGNVDVEMYWAKDPAGPWHNVEDPAYSTIFNYDNWEPGYTDVKYIKIKNAGSLALNYKLAITPETAVGKLAEVINVHYATDGIKINDRTDLQNMATLGLLSNVLRDDHVIEGTLMADGQQNPYHPESEVILTLAMTMITTAGNDYQNETAGSFGITALATQAPYEEDSFGANYDSAAELPIILSGDTVSAEVENVNGAAAKDVTLQGVGVSATIPAGTLLEDGADRVTLMVTPLEKTTSGITAVNGEILIPVDVHVDGVAENNTTPIIVNLGQVLPKGLNMGNYTLYHVEDGTNKVMTLVNSAADLSAHNTFTYDPVTGEVSVAMASFSEVALIADTVNPWNGDFATEFSGGTGTEDDPYIIANADQLAYFNEVISNDNENYGDKYYKLNADVNLGGEGENAPIFYPIGYHKVGEEIATAALDDEIPEAFYIIEEDTKLPANMAADDGSTWYTYGGSFKGTFDGNGHKVSNIYQNTWSMKGNYAGNYWNAAMGLFGYVNGGTVKNLTVDNFSSDGEFTPTGVIAAYAANSTFENIAITNCNPRVYNTGNGGIVGIGGNSSDPDTYKLTFTNITIDNTNKISALWGSWDVACGGLVGMFRGAGHAYMTNCHVAAQIDVYNDVCGNYQYYWYRYAGMMIGTNKNMTTDKDGYTVPETSKFHAENCTVHFGKWNDYYYCELVANSLASYTHDHQFSRLTEVMSVDEDKKTYTTTDDKTFDIPNSGRYNYVVVDDENEPENAKCYHFVDGEQWTHDKAGTETVNGETVLKEDKQCVYLPFNQLFTGYGWGVKHIPVYNGENYAFEGITILDREIADSVDKFETKFTGDFLYRVGNENTVSIDSLFKAKNGVTINNSGVWVSVDKVDENSNVSGTFTANTADWTQSTIQFSGTGVVKVTIQDYNFCTPTVLTLEVVDATNATSAANATKNNVVLLNDVGISTIEVSKGYTLYGNGFKMTATSDPMYDTMRAGFVTLDNGTLDNVQIICPNFSYAIIYNSQIKDSANTAVPSDSTNDARGNVRSAVMCTGNSKIVNSYVHGGRAAIFLRSGNLLVDGSTISGGAAANIHALSAQSLTLRNATLIQKPFTDNVHKTGNTLMGFSGLFECGEDGSSTPLILEGTLTQDAWINEGFVKYTPSAASSVVENALGKTAYLHDLDGDGEKESLNLGFTYIPQDANGSTSADNITDNRTNKDTVPYAAVDVGSVFASAKVYSYKNTNGTSDEFKTVGDYTPSAQGATAPTVTFTDANADRVFETKFDANDGRWESTLSVNLDNGNYTFSWDKLLVQKHGTDSKYTVKTSDGTKVDTNNSISLTKTGTTDYILTVTDGDVTHTVYFTIAASKTSIPEPVVADTTGGTPLLVVKSKNSDWSCAIPALEGIKVKYYTINGEVILDLATLTPTNTGKQNGTNNYWETTNDGYKLKVTCGVIHDTKAVYGMPVVVDNNGTKQMYFTISSTNGYVSTGTAARSVTLTYEFTDPNGKTLTFTKNYNVKYADYKDVAQYSYSDFVKGTMTDLLTSSSSSSGGGCVTPDTLITLADGSKVRVDSLKGDEELLVWNLETGKLDKAPIMFVDSDPEAEYEVIKLHFSDGTEVKVISEHGFWDYDLNRYVYLDRNAADYIGHTFAKQGADGLEKVVLTDVVIETEVTTAWSPVTVGHLCYFTNDMLSMPGGVGGLFNIFEVDAETMTYDYEAIARDIETYGLFTYEEINAIAPLSEEMFYAAGGQYLKVSIGKGNLTEDELAAMITRYSKYI